LEAVVRIGYLEVKGRWRRPYSFPVWVVSIERTLVNQLYRRWLRLRRGLASWGCLRVLLHRRGWMRSEEGCKSKVVWLCLDSKIRSLRFVV